MARGPTENICDPAKGREEGAATFQCRVVSFIRCRERVLQTFAAALFMFLPTIASPLSWPIALTLVYYSIWARYLFGVYFVWMYFDRNIDETGGRRIGWYRDARVWEHLRDYFPLRLVKLAELPPDRNYLFAAYPHGIFTSGVYTAFGTSALRFEDMYPGLRTYICTVSILYKLPIIREIALAHGGVSVTKKSINWILGSPGTGRAAVVVAGGVEESSYNKPGTYKIVLERRKGFCQLALQNGSPLVPVFMFGETDLFNIVVPRNNSLLERFQLWTKNLTGIVPVIFYGAFGIIPNSVPVTVVVGKPIDVEKIHQPSVEQVDELHRKYKESLISLFNNEKKKYLKNPDTELIIT